VAALEEKGVTHSPGPRINTEIARFDMATWQEDQQ